MIRNGEPYFIKGGAAHPDYLQELKEAGANTARIYDTINLQKILDEAEALDLAVVVDIPLPQFYTDPEFYEEEELFLDMKRKIAKVVEKHKDHPALLYWNLGNEIHYPYLYRSTPFYSNFNDLIDLIHKIDPNHPISTTTIGANKLEVVSISIRSPQLDFISFNSFGTLSIFAEKLRPIEFFWNGPLAITEWGVNGPWEAELTSWKAPIEETSTKKAEQIRERYYEYVEPLKEKNSFGSFIFYWGKKIEVTPTWYSLFGDDKLKTEAVFQMQKIWTNQKISYNGPRVDYLLLNDKGAADNVILNPGSTAIAEIFVPENSNGPFEYCWEIRKESWHERLLSEVVHNVEFQQREEKVTFSSPGEEGPYRLFVYINNGTEYLATANIPFYILNPENGE